MSKTEENLKTAFAGESQARNKYNYYAKIAKKEGYHYIAKIFDETAENEMRHAKDEFALLNGLGSTLENLKAAYAGEDYEVKTMYADFARIAEEEGHTEAAILFQQILKVETHHRDRYKKLIELVESGNVFKRENPIKWKCGVCGYIYEGTEPPQKCPCCKHPQEYYEPANLDF